MNVFLANLDTIGLALFVAVICLSLGRWWERHFPEISLAPWRWRWVGNTGRFIKNRFRRT